MGRGWVSIRRQFCSVEALLPDKFSNADKEVCEGLFLPGPGTKSPLIAFSSC